MNTQYTFGAFSSTAHITQNIPSLAEISGEYASGNGSGQSVKVLLVCDEHTAPIADAICASARVPRCVLPSGEANKNWNSVETILRAAREAGLGRDGLFIGVGGGVIGDMTAFAASVYMRGCRLALVCTTLLSMVDAGLGGKTGFDLFGIKNFAGTFYPAAHVYMPIKSLATLPPCEWKSGMAELIKTAIIDGAPLIADADGFLDELAALGPQQALPGDASLLERCIQRSVEVKARIVEADPLEKGEKRIFLNLGHTFGHALEAAAGLGSISHGEAVAWGIARSCELGLAKGITPQSRAGKILALLESFDYEIGAPHPLLTRTMSDTGEFLAAFALALAGDKKQKNSQLVFIVPAQKSVQALTISSENDINTITNMVTGAK